MRILLVGNYYLDGQHSMLRFCATLEMELRAAGHDVRVIRPKASVGRKKPTQTGLEKWLGYIDKFLVFIPRLKRAARWADVVHICDQAYSSYTRFLVGVPKVVTCHDLLAVRSALGEFQGQTVGWSGRKYQRMILRGLERASFVACDSIATRSDLLRLSGVPANRTALVHVGFNFKFARASDSECRDRLKRFGIEPSDHYMIHVGADVWYKNLRGVVEIFSRLVVLPEAQNFRLVMVGAGVSSEFSCLTNKFGLEGRVVTLSNVSSEELCALYSRACGLLFPSLCEGFGWPIIEAQACGCPVFATDRPPMTEVGGDGAVYFNPERYDEAASIIRSHLSREAKMRDAGFRNAKRFSAVRTAAGYVRVYSEAIAFEKEALSERARIFV
jgi:glycosyltransferase involved in cell wall biosynthesis